jgi:26S proteasome regulatory subunit N11
MMGIPSTEARQTTSNIGFLKKPTIQARIHGLDRHYYSLVIDWRKNDLEEQMLMNLHRKDWSNGLIIKKFEEQKQSTEILFEEMVKLSSNYSQRVKEEEGKTLEEIEILKVGKVDPKRHLDIGVMELLANSILQSLGTMICTVIF